jgi:hypothetical protein
VTRTTCLTCGTRSRGDDNNADDNNNRDEDNRDEDNRDDDNDLNANTDLNAIQIESKKEDQKAAEHIWKSLPVAPKSLKDDGDVWVKEGKNILCSATGKLKEIDIQNQDYSALKDFRCEFRISTLKRNDGTNAGLIEERADVNADSIHSSKQPNPTTDIIGDAVIIRTKNPKVAQFLIVGSADKNIGKDSSSPSM